MERKYILNINYDYNNPILTWQPYPDSVNYRVYRGMNKDNMEKIKETNLLQYKDTTDIRTNFDRIRWYYVISSVNENGDETIFTDYIQLNYLVNSPYKNIIRDIIRKHEIVINRIAGEQVDFYLKKQSGQRCPECFNEFTRDTETEKELCPNCFGTSFKGGFEKITQKTIIRNAQDKINEMPYGFELSSEKQGLVSIYPFLNTGDWFRTKQGEIYLIDAVEHERFQGSIVLQILALKLLHTTHKYYDIEL